MNEIDKNILNDQKNHWEKSFAKFPNMLGLKPSWAAIKAAELFHKNKFKTVLELGAGQGRDTFFFVQEGFLVQALDYSEVAINCLKEKAKDFITKQKPSILSHDLREKLPFENESLDACFAHMLLCMALTTKELEFMIAEVKRVLKDGGLFIYTARNDSDPHYGSGLPRGEDMYEVNGFIVHFFNKNKVLKLGQEFTIKAIEEFEEGELPRKLFMVTMKKTRL